jgi:hypothetical protein
LNPITSGEVTHVKLKSEMRLLSLSLAFFAIFFPSASPGNKMAASELMEAGEKSPKKGKMS